MSEMPTRVQIGPYRYQVEHSHAAMRQQEQALGRKHHLGSHSYSEGLIAIAPNQTEDCARDTLLHEVLHGIDTAFHIIPGDADAAEAIIGPLSTTLLDTLRRNPELVAYLMTEEEE